MSVTRRKASDRNAPDIKKEKVGSVAKEELDGRTGEIPDKKAFSSLCLFCSCWKHFCLLFASMLCSRKSMILHFSEEKEKDFFVLVCVILCLFFHPLLQSAMDLIMRLLQTENFVF